MTVMDVLKELLEKKGLKQCWIVERMNLVKPEVQMNSAKFSAVLNGTRKLSADELLAFCIALEISPDIFLEKV